MTAIGVQITLRHLYRRPLPLPLLRLHRHRHRLIKAPAQVIRRVQLPLLLQVHLLPVGH